jgi:signal transduction histidine kinase
VLSDSSNSQSVDMNVIDLTKRASKEQLLFDYAAFTNESYFIEVIKDLQGYVLIINNERQIIYANQTLLDLLCLNDSIDLLGVRYGEAINCINANLVTTGCGTSENCKFCGILNTILDCQKLNKKVSNEATVFQNLTGVNKSIDLLVKCTSINLPSISCLLLHLEDCSEKERKSSLDSIFFHDILNTAGLLKGLSDLILKLDAGNETSGKYIKIMNDLTSKLMDEINSQKILIQAENGKLQLKINSITSLEIIEESVSYLSFQNDIISHKLCIDESSINCNIQTDLALLRRVLINMLKNALEASNRTESISIGCKVEKESVVFYVKNNAFIPIENQTEIFKRSFSTKAKTGRGLGTYSMKLIAEQYLGGRIFFVSSETDGTTFYIRIPFAIQ